MPQIKNKQDGFTLTELLTVVAILGVISAIAMPLYTGYIDTSRSNITQNNLRAIYMQQQEYYNENNAYYSSGGSCGDHATVINTNLFDGTQVLDATYYNYCILQGTSNDFTAQAVRTSDSTTYTLNHNNVDNF